ncbi:MAG TPA: hypothetical protein VNG33_02220 [Polyangiaceae bacterium]|nr:hypothetical protein [Polyangiaceae bacterium]
MSQTRSRQRVFSPALLALAASATACVPDFDTDLSELSEPRLLAIASSPAETQAQKQVTLTALVAIPEGQKAPAIDWTMCLARKPLTELGPVNPLCLAADDGSGAVVDLGQGASVTATLDKDVCKLFGPLRPSPKAGEGAGRPSDPDVTGGFYQPFAARLGGAASLGSVRLDCDLANIDRDQALSYRQQYRVNENPRLSSVARVTDQDPQPLPADDAAPLVLRAGDQLRLRAGWDECSGESRCGDGSCTAFEDQTSCPDDCSGTLRGCTGAEPYVWYDPERQRVEPRREGISVAWYASRGHFENEQTGLDEAQATSTSFTENTYIPGRNPGPATLWLVIRDSRGGQSWEIRHIELTP